MTKGRNGNNNGIDAEQILRNSRNTFRQTANPNSLSTSDGIQNALGGLSPQNLRQIVQEFTSCPPRSDSDFEEESDSEEPTTTQQTVNFDRLSCRDLTVLEEIENTEIVTDDQSDTTSRTNIYSPGFLDLERATSFGKNRGFGQGPGDVPGPFPGRPDVSLQDASTPVRAEEEALDPISELLEEYYESGLETPFDQELSQLNPSSIYGLGKHGLFTNIMNFGGKTSNLEERNIIQNPLTADHVKYFNGSFYTLEDNNGLLFFRNSYDKKYLKIKSLAYSGPLSEERDYEIQEDWIFQFDSYFRNAATGPLADTTSTLKNKFIVGNSDIKLILPNQTVNIFKFKPLVDESRILKDHTFIMKMPFENNELLNDLNLVGASIVDVRINYNFYIKKYEEIANKYSNSLENTFPNLYILMKISEESDLTMNDKNKRKNTNPALNSFLSANGSISNVERTLSNGMFAFFDPSSNASQAQIRQKGKYFESFGFFYDQLASDSNLMRRYANNNKNIILLSDYVKRLNIVNEKKYMFPMNIELSIPTDKSSIITKMLHDTNLIDNFVAKLCEAKINSKFSTEEMALSEQIIQQNIRTDFSDNSEQATIKNTFNSKKLTMNSYSFKDILEDILKEPVPASLLEMSTFIGDEKRILKNTENSLFINNLRKIIFQGKLNTFTKKNNRSYAEILSGKNCYNETLVYRIDKMLPGSNVAIQSYWIPNDPDLDLLSVIDTQVKYGQEYMYKIYAYQIVLGNTYIQKIPTFIGPAEEITLRIFKNMSPMLFEVELLTLNRKVVDSPPLTPEVQFIPYSKVDNRIGFFLNTRIGRQKMKPIIIFDSDQKIIDEYIKDTKGTVRYGSDDIAQRFEILKLDKAPLSYQDFKNGFIKVAKTGDEKETSQISSAAFFMDQIEPNKKYYYCFRAIDNHSNVSNPTEIFEFEMINQNGMIFPIIKNYDFPKPNYNNFINMRRFIKIKPSTQHTMVNMSNSNISNITTQETAADSIRKVRLGITNIGDPWNKTFKMVITSKKTGKKSEIKFKFKYILE